MSKTYDVGMVGLGVMGYNLLLNMADHGYSVIGYDRDSAKVQALQHQGQQVKVKVTDHFEDFIHSLKSPKVIILLVPSGKPVEAVLSQLNPYLDEGDIIIDGGNSHFSLTNGHQEHLEKEGVFFIGMGVSGGEKGAREGPCLMPGGDFQAYKQVKPLLEAIAAKVDGIPCVTYIGPGPAGHYVKMVHNGIEYGLMKLISETYELLKTGLKLTNKQLHEVYKAWNRDKVASFLIEITAIIFQKKDEETGKDLIDQILDAAEQKGTGLWTSEDAMRLHVPVPTIDVAVSMRDLSTFKSLRSQVHKVLQGPSPSIDVDAKTFITALLNALYAGMILTYTQGMSLLQTASQTYHYNLNLADIATIWRGGCIIRSNLLDHIARAFRTEPALPLLMLDPYFASELSSVQSDLRLVIQHGAGAGIAIPGLMSALGYYDSYRCDRLPSNLIQAQRDFFGSHNYRRVDKEGYFHTEWEI